MADSQTTISNIRVTEEHDPAIFDPIKHVTELGLDAPPKDMHPLDKQAVRNRFDKVRRWFSQERARQLEFRREAMVDHEFYDGFGQWTEEERRALAERSQLPITFNQVKPTVDWVLGTEKKIRVDYRILPRGEEDVKAAESKTKLFKYVSDINNAGFKRSKSFSDCVLAGVGWIDHGINTDPENDPIVLTYEDWRYVWWDSLSVEDDLSDARYVFRGKWVDLDVACAMFPDRADVINASVLTNIGNGQGNAMFSDMLDPADDLRASGIMPHSAYGESQQYTGFFGAVGGSGATEPRDRVFLIECQYRIPVKKTILKGVQLPTPLKGVTYDATRPDLVNLVNMGIAHPVEQTAMELRHMIFVNDYVVQDCESPFRHKRFTLVPIWGFKRKKDGTPYGIVRNLRDPQKDLNKRRSKALYLLSANRVTADADAIEGTNQSWSDVVQEANRPDGLILQNPRSKRGIEVENDARMAREHVELMEQDAKYIQSASGVTDELMGRDTNAVSGKAIIARQEQGGVVTTAFFDNLRLAFKLSGEILLSLIEQYYDQAKVVRISGGDNGRPPEFMPINQYDPLSGQTLGDITAHQADFIVSEQDYSATIRKAMFDTMTEMVKGMPPEVSMQLLDLVFDLSDLPGKEKFVDRIRSMNGQKGSEGGTMTPEEMAQEQAKAAAAEEQARLENEVIQTKLAAEKAKIAKIERETDLVAAKIATESVHQDVSAAGVDYDREKLRIEKAVALNNIESSDVTRESQRSAMTQAKDKPKGAIERGLKSNNEEKGE